LTVTLYFDQQSVISIIKCQAKSQQWQETKTPPVTEWRKKPWEKPAESNI